MLELKEIKKVNKLKRLEKVNHFLNENKFQFSEDYEVFFLKSIIEKGEHKTLDNLKKLIDFEKNFKIALLRNSKIVNLNKIDSENIIEIYSKEYYDLYLIKNKLDMFYMLIQENNFHKNRPNFELKYFKKIHNFHDIIFIKKQKLN